jgi:transposase
VETILVQRSCGLDVHQETVVACLLLQEPGKNRPRKVVQTFGTFRQELLDLRQWLLDHGVTDVGMESTGVYWMPVYAVLEEEPSLTLIVGNAQHIKNVPARKTDVSDAQWIATLVRLGLIKPSFVPPKPLRELRKLLRARRTLVQCQADERNRVLKLLEMAHLKLDQVATDVFGASGMAMLKAIAAGETDVVKLANMAKGRLRQQIPALRLALDGRMSSVDLLLLRMHLVRLAHSDVQIRQVDEELDRRMEPYREPLTRLQQIPCVGLITAMTMVAEMGVDMAIFPTAGHLAAWAGVCPGNHQSGGKRRNAPARKGNPYLRAALVEAAQSARRLKRGYLRDKFFRLQSRRGAPKAKMAIAHKIVVAAWHMLKDGSNYKDLGEAYIDRLDERHVVSNLLKRLEQLGYAVQATKRPEPCASAA